MDLSIIIVNYNVRYFLEQCLHAVHEAIGRMKEEGYTAEVFVVDNNSVDGSVADVRHKFPGVTLIENRENAGFSKANNQAIARSSGRYVLLLNPDTVVEEDTFQLCIDFMDTHPDAGALGVKMIDGKGAFLPESKRSLPTPESHSIKCSDSPHSFHDPGASGNTTWVTCMPTLHMWWMFWPVLLCFFEKRPWIRQDTWMKAFSCMERILISPTGSPGPVTLITTTPGPPSYTTREKAQEKGASTM